MSLSNIDGVVISLSTLLRHLRTLGLSRRKADRDLLGIVAFLQDQLNTYAMLHGYKMMHRKCIRYSYMWSSE